MCYHICCYKTIFLCITIYVIGAKLRWRTCLCLCLFDFQLEHANPGMQTWYNIIFIYWEFFFWTFFWREQVETGLHTLTGVSHWPLSSDQTGGYIGRAAWWRPVYWISSITLYSQRIQCKTQLISDIRITDCKKTACIGWNKYTDHSIYLSMT